MKRLALVVFAAVVGALVSVGAQRLLAERSSPAVTGGMVGAVVAVLVARGRSRD
jgi:hypothetical protein